MTKAERIFKDTRWECRKHIIDWPDEDGSAGYNRLAYRDDESISQRTINDIRKILESKKRGVAIDRQLGISTPEKLDIEEKTLRMVEATLNNSERSLNEWKHW